MLIIREKSRFSLVIFEQLTGSLSLFFLSLALVFRSSCSCRISCLLETIIIFAGLFIYLFCSSFSCFLSPFPYFYSFVKNKKRHGKKVHLYIYMMFFPIVRKKTDFTYMKKYCSHAENRLKFSMSYYPYIYTLEKRSFRACFHTKITI